MPNLEHEEALKQFIAQILVSDDRNAFLRDFSAFHDRIAHCAMVNGLGQTLLKIISPGVPNFYQGSELWDFRLVDPDNRKPVDFAQRKAALASMQGAKQSPCTSLAEDLAKNWHDGKIKMYVIWKALGFRLHNTDPFSRGDFAPLAASGQRQENISVYLRRHGRKALLVVLPRWLAAAGASESSMASQEFWADTHVPLSASDPKAWRNVFTGETVSISQATSPTHSLRIGELLRHFPVAMPVLCPINN